MKFKNLSYLVMLGLAALAAGCGTSANNQVGQPGLVTSAGMASYSLPVGCYGYTTPGTSCIGGSSCPVGFMSQGGYCVPGNSATYGVNPCTNYGYGNSYYWNSYLNTCQPISYGSSCGGYGSFSSMYGGCITASYSMLPSNCSYSMALGGAGYMYYCH